MPTTPVNSNIKIISGSGGSCTGSYAGFTTVQNTTFDGLRDVNGGFIVTSSFPVIINAGVKIEGNITSASISAGAAFFYY